MVELDMCVSIYWTLLPRARTYAQYTPQGVCQGEPIQCSKCWRKMSSLHISLAVTKPLGKALGHTELGKYWISSHYHLHHTRATTHCEPESLLVTISYFLILVTIFYFLITSAQRRNCHWSIIFGQPGLDVRMKFPRANALRSGFRLPTRANKKGKFDPERLSFFIVVTFFSIFAVIVIIELLYKDFEEE